MTSPLPYAEVIGDPIAHSKSPTIHRFWLEKLGLEGDYRAVRVGKDDLSRYLNERRRDPAWRGCNVTMPLKQEVLPFAARLSRDVQHLQAANCLVPSADGALEAVNFDVDGVAVPLQQQAKSSHPDHVTTCVQVIGSGGAARAAGLGARKAGYEDLDVFTRNQAKGKEVAALLGTRSGQTQPLEALAPIRTEGDGAREKRYAHILINATPMGMRGQPEVPVDLSLYHPDTIVFDMVYDPLETGLIRQAREQKMRTIDGLTMLIEQAALSFERFFGAAPPREHDASLRSLVLA